MLVAPASRPLLIGELGASEMSVQMPASRSHWTNEDCEGKGTEILEATLTLSGGSALSLYDRCWGRWTTILTSTFLPVSKCNICSPEQNYPQEWEGSHPLGGTRIEFGRQGVHLNGRFPEATPPVSSEVMALYVTQNPSQVKHASVCLGTHLRQASVHSEAKNWGSGTCLSLQLSGSRGRRIRGLMSTL